MGARPHLDGLSGVHTHMTNSLNTPVEAFEHSYPARVVRYGLRRDSGGAGLNRGGDGVVREIRFLSRTQVTVLSDRRRFRPTASPAASLGSLAAIPSVERTAGFRRCPENSRHGSSRGTSCRSKRRAAADGENFEIGRSEKIRTRRSPLANLEHPQRQKSPLQGVKNLGTDPEFRVGNSGHPEHLSERISASVPSFPPIGDFCR